MKKPFQPMASTQGVSQAASLALIASDAEIFEFLQYHQPDLQESKEPRVDRFDSENITMLTQYFRFEFLAQAYSNARSIELHSRPSHMLSVATRQLYSRAVRRLTTADQNGDPYNQFAMLAAEQTAMSKYNRNAYYQSKAALNREAARVMLDELPLVLGALTAFLKRASAQMIKEDRSHSDRMAIAAAFRKKFNAYADWHKQHYHVPLDKSNFETPSKISMNSLLEITRATKYLIDFPPDLHGVRGRTGYRLPHANDESKGSIGLGDAIQDNHELPPHQIRSQPMPQKMHRSKAKRKVLTRLSRIEINKRKKDQNYDWRTAIWSEALCDKHINDAQRALIAVQIALAPRPIETAMGLTIYLLREDYTTDGDRLLIRINGAKTGDTAYFDDEHEKYRKTNDDLSTIAELKSDPQVRDFNTKGQRWKLFELDCAYPETRWLATYVRRTGVPLATTYSDSLAADEAAALKPFMTAISHVVFVQHEDRHGEPVAGTGLAAEGFRMDQAIAFSKLLARLGKRAFPRLKDRITSYVYRHALASDLKSAGVTQADISKTIGHISGRTATRYGSAQHAKNRLYSNRALAIRSRTTANSIRNTQVAVPRFSNNGQKHS